MTIGTRRADVLRVFTQGLAVACVLLPHLAAAQGLTGNLVGTVVDQQGSALAGAVVRISSPALIGGAKTSMTDENGQLHLLSLPPGQYVLDIELPGFRSYREDNIPIRAGGTIDRSPIVLTVGILESVDVQAAGSRRRAMLSVTLNLGR